MDVGVEVVGDDAALAEAVRAAGARVTRADASVLLADARTEALPDPLGAEAERRGVALLALVADGDGSDRAYAAGATHVVEGHEPAALARALRFAARYAARTGGRSEAANVRAAVDAWLAAHDEATVLIVALPRFAVVNAAFGRSAGDALLAQVRQRIEQALDEGALVTRRGGAEFVVASTDRGAAERVTRALEAPFAADGGATTLGHRIGAARRHRDEDAGALLQRAHEALTAAKASDAAPVRQASTAGAGLAADLHRALDRGEIAVLFQPQVALASGAITGVEALARWAHPGGVLGADALFDAAERADLGRALSDHIQALALEEAGRWPEALEGLRLSINVTAADMAHDAFADRFLARIDAAGIARARVTAEITEGGLIDDLSRAAALLARLRGAGCRVAIDDFGTGYSSLAYLKALPLDYLKIDQSLVADAAGPERDRALVRGVIAIARSLGLETIAEGVETAAQRDALAAEGCGYYQGYLCAQPLDSAALARVMEDGCDTRF